VEDNALDDYASLGLADNDLRGVAGGDDAPLAPQTVRANVMSPRDGVASGGAARLVALAGVGWELPSELALK
jgi:chitodextrinase